MKMLRFVMVLVVLTSLALSACAAPAATPAAPVVQTQIVERVVTVMATSAPAAPLATAPAPAGPTEIAVIVKTGNSSFWQNVQTAAFDAQKALKAQDPKVSVTFLGAQSESNINEQINIVESAIDRGVKAIVLAPSDVKALVPAVKKAMDAKIPVIIIDSKLSGDASQYVSFLATDNKAAGAAAAKTMVDMIKAKTGKDTGKIIIMSYVAGVGSEVDRVGGFTDYIKANSHLTLLPTQYSNSDMPTALNQTTNVLAANPDIIGMFGANEPTAIGMGRAIAQAKMGGKIIAIGYDGAKAEADFVKDGTLSAIVVQSGYQMGFKGVNAAYDAIQGKTVPAYVDTGYLMVTKDNVDSQDAKNVLY